MVKTHIIHISGSPGTGKTTFATDYAGNTDVTIVETDLFIQRGDSNGKKLMKVGYDNVEKYTKLWREILIGEFKANSSHKTKVVIFVGLLHNFGPKSGEIFTFPFETNKKQCVHKYFMKIHPELLLKRFYTRLIKCKYDSTKNFWRDVVNEKIHIEIPSSRQLLKAHVEEIKIHTDDGYKILSVEEIRENIDKLLVDKK